MRVLTHRPAKSRPRFSLVLRDLLRSAQGDEPMLCDCDPDTPQHECA
jgi:hypothetical protein